jgi:thiamine-monophosphate kinase
MAMGEFDLIRRCFAQPAQALLPDSQVRLGIGDDCALLQPSPGKVLAVSTDMLVAGRHFFPDVAPHALGHKALAVNLSDLAAMGARPLGFTLALALPQADEAWLGELSAGLLALAQAHHCPLVGGDTTRGPLNLCITVFGEVSAGAALRRDAAQPGDDLWVSGQPGEARLALEGLWDRDWARASLTGPHGTQLRARLERPEPRLALGQTLAHLSLSTGRTLAALDLSDGLAGDLGHILHASGVGATLHESALPLSDALRALPTPYALDCVLHGGDDYELLWCAPPSLRDAVRAAAQDSGTAAHRIGQIHREPGLFLQASGGQRQPLAARGFDHFSP